MKEFADLHILISATQADNTESLIRFASRLGYKTVGFSSLNGDLLNIFDKFKILGEKHGVDIAKRIDLKPLTSDELIRELNRVRLKYEIIAVECKTKSVAHQAAKDRRVDLLFFPISQNKVWFGKAEAELASGSNVAIEINLSQVIQTEKQFLSQVLFKIQREVFLAQKYGIPIVASSGAKTIYDIRAPYDIISFMQCFNISRADSLNALSKNPMSIVERNRNKLNPSTVSSGVKIVKGG